MKQNRRSQKKYRASGAQQGAQPKAAAPLVYYRCPKCFHSFDDRVDAVACEASHLTPVSVKATKFTVKAYPFAVEVTFQNGEKQTYIAETLNG